MQCLLPKLCKGGINLVNFYIGDREDAMFDPFGYFDFMLDESCLDSDFAKKIVKEIDKSDLINRNLIISPILGQIPPSKLSGGTKALLVLKFTNNPLYLDSFGENCYKYIAEIGETKDVTIVTTRISRFFWRCEGLECVKVLNTNKIVRTDRELFDEILDWRAEHEGEY